MKKTTVLLFLCWTIACRVLADSPLLAPTAPISYTLSMPQPQTHYFEVAMELSGIDQATNLRKNGYVDVKMPVWTPGSYLIREYAKNVEGFRATAGGQPARSEKIRKNTWRVYASQEPIRITYKVYAYELTVRTSFLDESHGYLNGASIFLYVDPLRNQPHRLVVNPFKDWKKIATGLARVEGEANTFLAPDYDILVDSPLEIGNHRSFTFTAAGIPHEVAMYGETTYDEKRLADDLKRVCEAATSVFGEHPCKDYTFIVHHTPNGGGGLEHLNSTTLQVTRNAYQSASSYQSFLSLAAHEYFHLWNVKRIRPKQLGPFDYENENYTNLLWVAEGITSFYQNYLLRRAGLMTADQYVKSFSGGITGIENQPGNRVQSVAEASMDAWIKYYRPNENSINSEISYYSKGAVLGGLLNLAILSASNGQRNLDDVMRLLWDEYYKKQKRGFTDQEFQKAVEQVAGQKMDDFFTRYVYGTDAIDYNKYFAPVGLELVDLSGAKNDAFLGAAGRSADGKFVVTSVRRDSPAWKDGINVNDEIVSLNGVRVGADLNAALTGFKPGQTIEVLINRGGLMKKISTQLIGNPLGNFQLMPVANQTPQQRTLYNRWLYLSNT